MTFPPPTMNASVGGFPPPSEGTIGNIPPPPPPDQVSIGGFPPPQAKSGLPNIEFPAPKEKVGAFTQAYRSTLKPVLDFFRDNEVESTKLIPIEDYQPPKPTTDKTMAAFQLLNGINQYTPESVREDQVNELGKLSEEGKLFTEEAVERLAKTGYDPEYARKVLLTGLGEGKKFRRDISFQQAIKEGYQESATGIITGSGTKDYETLLQRAESEIPFLKRQTKNLSKLFGDLPAFAVGGLAASLPAGGPETPVGAVLAASGAFSTQALIESGYNEALRLVDKHPELSGKTLQQLAALVTDPEALKSIGGSVLEAGSIGALVALNPLFKAVEKTPLAKLFHIPVVKSAAKLGSEVTTLSVAPAALQGRIPTAEDFLDNAILLGGVHLSVAGSHKLAQWAQRGKVIADDVASRLGNKFTVKDEAALEAAKTVEEVDAILAEVESRPEVSSVQAEPKAAAETLVAEKGGKEAPEKPREPTAKQRAPSSLGEGAVLEKPEHIKIGSEGGKGVASIPVAVEEEGHTGYRVKRLELTKEEQQLVDSSNAWDKAGDRAEGSKLAQQAREMIFNRLTNAKEAPKQKLKSVEPKGKELDVPKEAKGEKVLTALTPKEEIAIVSNQTKSQDFLNKKPTTLKEAHEYMFELNQLMEKTLETINKHKKDPNYKKDKMLQMAVNSLQDKLGAFHRRFTQTKEAMANAKDGVVKLPNGPRIGLRQPEQAERTPNPMGKGTEAPKKTEIMQMFKDAFKETPFRLGKFPPGLKRKANGYYSLNTDVIRLKEAGMIETAAHELGHKLHMALFGGDFKTPLKQQVKNINAALKPYMHELKPISRYAPHELEGFAEFTRMYVTKPEAAKTVAPEFYKFFEAEMKAKAPEALELLHLAREMHEKYLNANPVARTYSHIQSGYDTTMFARTKDWLKGVFNLDKLKTSFLDEYFPIKRAVADALGIAPVQVENWKSPLNAYVAARTLKGWVGKAEVFLMHETFNVKTLKSNGKGLKQILEPIKSTEERKELSAYLVAKRALLLGERNIKSGLDFATADDTVRQLKGKYDGIAKELHDYQDRVLQYYRDAGMMNMDTYKKIRSLNEFYVPFHRFFEEGEKSIGKKGAASSKLQATKQVHKIFGSTREVIDPLESIVNNTFALIQSAEKNQFGQVLSKLTDISPRGGKYMERVTPKIKLEYEVKRQEIIDAVMKEAKKKGLADEEGNVDEKIVDILEQLVPDSIMKFRAEGWGQSENTMTIYYDGKPQYYETTPEINELYKNGGAKYVGGMFTKLLNIPAKTLRAGAILNPQFIQKNAIRDLLGGVVFTKHNGKAIIDDVYKPYQGLMASIGKTDLFVDWMKAGGGMATLQSLDKSVLSIRKGLINGIDKLQPIRALRRMAEISEEMNRLAEYSKAVEAMGTDRWQKQMAAFQARDISIDFAKTGSATKAINQIVPFWNATIQGGDKLVRTFASRDPEVIQRFMTRVSAGIIVPSLLLAIANDGDKDIKELPDITADSNFVFRSPVSGELIKIPVPFETGVLFHGLTRRFYDFCVTKDPHAFDGLFGSMVEATMPNFLNQFEKPFIEVYANKDFFQNRHIVHPSQTGLISEEQYGVFTSKSARLIAKGLEYMPAVDKYNSWLTSPDIVEHFIRSWTGGLGGLTLKISDKILTEHGIMPAVARPEESLLQQWGLAAFEQKFPTARTKSVTEYYDTYGLWNKLQRSVDAKLEKGDIEGAKRLQKDQLRLAPVDMKSMAKAMQKNQALINNVYHNPVMTSQEKSILIEALYRQQIAMAQSFNNNIKQARERMKEKE